MEVIVVLVFISVCLVTIALLFFASRIRQGDFEHGDRLSLLPLESDDAPAPAGPAASQQSTEPKPITPSSNVPGHEGEDPDDK